MRWRLLVDAVGRPGWHNMALDQWLLDQAERTGDGFVRLYRWEPACLSFGRHEPALRRYDRAEVLRRDIDAVRRPTGGRAVWHGRELTYAVAAPVSSFGDEARRPVSHKAFQAIHEMLWRAVRRLGVPATLAPTTTEAGSAIGAGACFASATGGEVLVGGRKLVGSAQLRQGSAFLQHGSLLLDDSQSLVADVTRGPPPVSNEITLREAAGRAIGFVQAASAVVSASRQWGGEWHLAQAPNAVALAIHADRFRDPRWTWRR